MLVRPRPVGLRPNQGEPGDALAARLSRRRYGPASTRDGQHADLREPGLRGKSRQFLGLEARPYVRLGLAERLVPVRTIVDDEEPPPGREERGESRDGGAWNWRVMKHATCNDDVRPDTDEAAHFRAVHLAADELDVVILSGEGAAARSVEARLAAIDGNHALEERRYRLEHGAVPRAGVDGNAPPREERAEREEIRAEVSSFWLGVQMRGRKIFARAGISRADHISDAREAALFLTEPPPFDEGVGHDGIGRGALGESEERARAVSSVGEEPRLAQRARVPRHVRLCLLEELGELADGKLRLCREREQSKPHGIGEKPIQVPASVCDHRSGHELQYMRLFTCTQ